MYTRKHCNSTRRNRDRHQRKGASLALAVVLMFTLFSFLALSIDTGYLAQSKAEMRRSADAAALAGCWELYQQLELGSVPSTGELDGTQESVKLAAAAMAASNPVCNEPLMLSTDSTTDDVQIGYLDSLQSATLSSNPSAPFYAVRVLVSRTAERNGEIPYFFGRIFGDAGHPMQVSATAVMARSVAGFQLPNDAATSLDILPFALDEQTWNNMLSGGGDDDFSYDPTTGEVTRGSDGFREMNLYPQGTGSPGNRGTVDIGGANNSTNDIARQIVHGISSNDLLELGKPLILDDEGTLTLNGDTGISAGVKDELASIIGQKRIIPIFASVSGNGNNANYTIVKWAGVRILDVKLTGKMSGKRVIIQPASVITKNAIVSGSGGTSSDYLFSPVILAR